MRPSPFVDSDRETFRSYLPRVDCRSLSYKPANTWQRKPKLYPVTSKISYRLYNTVNKHSMASKQAPTLLTLPLELRLQVYDYIITPSTAKELIEEPALFRTCRQIRMEMVKLCIDAICVKIDSLWAERHEAMKDWIHRLFGHVEAGPAPRQEDEIMQLHAKKDELMLEPGVEEGWRSIKTAERRVSRALRAAVKRDASGRMT